MSWYDRDGPLGIEQALTRTRPFDWTPVESSEMPAPAPLHSVVVEAIKGVALG